MTFAEMIFHRHPSRVLRMKRNKCFARKVLIMLVKGNIFQNNQSITIGGICTFYQSLHLHIRHKRAKDTCLASAQTQERVSEQRNRLEIPWKRGLPFNISFLINKNTTFGETCSHFVSCSFRRLDRKSRVPVPKHKRLGQKHFQPKTQHPSLPGTGGVRLISTTTEQL